MIEQETEYNIDGVKWITINNKRIDCVLEEERIITNEIVEIVGTGENIQTNLNKATCQNMIEMIDKVNKILDKIPISNIRKKLNSLERKEKLNERNN